MRLKHIKGSEEVVNKSKCVIHNPEDYKGKWSSLFGNKNKIYLEIGMGKGSFLLNLARENKNINYIGIEKYPSVLLGVIETIEKENINNLKIICVDARKVSDIFYKEISKIYLNFSDPWPKKRHEKRRLTSSEFLKSYNSIFKGLKVIEQKTDNDEFFKYSLEMYKINKYFVIKKNNNYFDKVRTEYEEKFIRKGKNINYVKVIKF